MSCCVFEGLFLCYDSCRSSKSLVQENLTLAVVQTFLPREGGRGTVWCEGHHENETPAHCSYVKSQFKA